MMVFFFLKVYNYFTGSTTFVVSTDTESTTTVVVSVTSVVTSDLVSVFLQDTTVSVRIVNNAKIFFMFFVLNIDN